MSIFKAKQRGSLLILALWVLLFLSVLVTAIGYTVRQKIKFAERIDDRQNLRYIAEAGVQKAIAVISRKNKTSRGIRDSLKDEWSHNSVEFKNVPLNNGYFNVRYADPDKAFSQNHGAGSEEAEA